MSKIICDRGLEATKETGLTACKACHIYNGLAGPCLLSKTLANQVHDKKVVMPSLCRAGQTVSAYTGYHVCPTCTHKESSNDAACILNRLDDVPGVLQRVLSIRALHKVN